MPFQTIESRDLDHIAADCGELLSRFVIPLSSLTEETKPGVTFCLVDVSRSMDETLDNAKGANKLQIERLPVTLLSFNTVVWSELPEPPSDLGNQSDWQKAKRMGRTAVTQEATRNSMDDALRKT